MNVRIRDYSPGDFPELTRIDRVCFPHEIAFTRAELRFHANHPAAITHVAEVGGTIAGFLIARIERHRAAHLITLDVVPEMRRNGVATRLVEGLHALLQRLAIPCIILEVDADNAPAVSLYGRLGYRTVETIPGYYGGTRDALRMVRVVSRPGSVAANSGRATS
jgi:ribosomal-protein-alanine N-acetyltransferase